MRCTRHDIALQIIALQMRVHIRELDEPHKLCQLKEMKDIILPGDEHLEVTTFFQ